MHDYALVDVPCNVCHLLVKPRAMFKHMKTHYMTFTCAVCDKEFKDSDAMDRHLSPKGVCDPDAWPCTNCGEVFGTESSLLAHIEASHRSRNQSKGVTKGVSRRMKEYKCEICDKQFTTHESRRCHMRIHTGERPFACPWCPKAFRIKSYLQYHMNTHTGERPFQCSQCDKAFTTSPNLHRHRHDVHENRRPYVCTICNKAFNQNAGLKLHVNTVHLKMPGPPRKKRIRNSSKVKREMVGEGSEDSGEVCEEIGEGCEEIGEVCEEIGDAEFAIEHYEELG